MSKGRPHRHFRRSSRRMATMRLVGVVSAVLAVVGVVGAGGVGSAAMATILQRTTLTLTVDGTRRKVTVADDVKTVADVLHSARITLRTGHVRTARTHVVIPGHETTPLIVLNGSIVGLDAPVRDLRTLSIRSGADEVEPTRFVDGKTLPAPGPPPVEYGLWHPGVPGRVRQAVGAISGEVVGDQTIPPVPAAPVTEKVVALTFDDGPWPDTPDFLRVLHDEGVRATFCMVGRQVAPMMDVVHQVAAAGMAVCNHTVDHNMYLDRAPADAIHADINGGADALAFALGHPPTLYRPPGGTLSPEIVATAQRAGEQVIHWTIDSTDYTKPGADAIVRRVIGQMKPGAIVLLHDGGGDRSQTLAAVPKIIETLKGQGYTFVTPDAVAPAGSGT